MSSHLDIARKELTQQRRLVSQDIAQLTRQLKKIDQALHHLAPISSNGSSPTRRNQPMKAERERRRGVVAAFWQDYDGGQQFDVIEFLRHTQEPTELGRAYAYLIRLDKDHFDVIKPGLYQVVK